MKDVAVIKMLSDRNSLCLKKFPFYPAPNKRFLHGTAKTEIEISTTIPFSTVMIVLPFIEK